MKFPRETREKVAALLALGETREKAAKAVDANRSTVYRWLQREPEFIATLEDLRQEVPGLQCESYSPLMQHSLVLASELAKAHAERIRSEGTGYAGCPTLPQAATFLRDVAGLHREAASFARLSKAETFPTDGETDDLELPKAETQAPVASEDFDFEKWKEQWSSDDA